MLKYVSFSSILEISFRLFFHKVERLYDTSNVFLLLKLIFYLNALFTLESILMFKEDVRTIYTILNYMYYCFRHLNDMWNIFFSCTKKRKREKSSDNIIFYL